MSDDFTPVRLSSKPADEPERVPFFYMDDVEYTIPKEVPPYVAMLYLKTLRTASSDRATSVVMDELIGKRGVDELARCKTMNKDQLKQLLDIVQKKIADVMEDVTGN